MKSVFEEIVDAHVVCPAESPEISKLRAELSRSLCPEDQKRLLRLVDGLNLLTEEAAFSNYREGLRNGMRLACAVFASRQGTPGEGEGLRNPDITRTDKGAVNGIGGNTPSRRSHSASRTDIASRDGQTISEVIVWTRERWKSRWSNRMAGRGKRKNPSAPKSTLSSTMTWPGTISKTT